MILFVITARPSYSRIRSALKALEARRHPFKVIPAASALLRDYGEVRDLIRADFPFHVTADVPSVVDGGGLTESAISTGLLTVQLSTILSRYDNPTVVTIADRKETLATAIAASYQNLRLCHVQGGEVSGSIDNKVRNAITQLADLHLVSTGTAAVMVSRMKPGAVVRDVGCPSVDLAAEAKRLGPLPGKDFVVIQHPVTTERDQAGYQMRQTIRAMASHGDKVMWFWPGEDAGNEEMAKELRLAGVHPVRNLEGVEFLRTLLGSGVLVGNSSVGIRECSFLGVPVVNVGNRQNGRERGPNVVDVSHDADAIWASASIIKGKVFPESHLYGDGKAGERIAEILVRGPEVGPGVHTPVGAGSIPAPATPPEAA